SPSSTHQLVQLFLHAASPRLAYHPDRKEVFHQCGKALLRRIAQDVGSGKGDYDLRSNKGGIAVSGDITLPRSVEDVTRYEALHRVSGHCGYTLLGALHRAPVGHTVRAWLTHRDDDLWP